jgi:hypothetical protein
MQQSDSPAGGSPTSKEKSAPPQQSGDSVPAALGNQETPAGTENPNQNSNTTTQSSGYRTGTQPVSVEESNVAGSNDNMVIQGEQLLENLDAAVTQPTGKPKSSVGSNSNIDKMSSSQFQSELSNQQFSQNMDEGASFPAMSTEAEAWMEKVTGQDLPVANSPNKGKAYRYSVSGNSDTKSNGKQNQQGRKVFEACISMSTNAVRGSVLYTIGESEGSAGRLRLSDYLARAMLASKAKAGKNAQPVKYFIAPQMNDTQSQSLLSRIAGGSQNKRQQGSNTRTKQTEVTLTPGNGRMGGMFKQLASSRMGNPQIRALTDYHTDFNNFVPKKAHLFYGKNEQDRYVIWELEQARR